MVLPVSIAITTSSIQLLLLLQSVTASRLPINCTDSLRLVHHYHHKGGRVEEVLHIEHSLFRETGMEDGSNLDELAANSGIDTADLWYNLLKGLINTRYTIRLEYAVNFFDMLRLAEHLNLSDKGVRRFWEWVLEGCRGQLVPFIDEQVEEIRTMLGKWVKDETIKSFEELRKKKMQIAVYEVPYYFDMFTDFRSLAINKNAIKDAQHIQWEVRTLRMCLMLRVVAQWDTIDSGLASLMMPSYKEDGEVFGMSILTDYEVDKLNSQSILSLFVYLQGKEQTSKLSECGLNLTYFWKTVRELLFMFDYRKLHLKVNTNNTLEDFEDAPELEILYDFDGDETNDLYRMDIECLEVPDWADILEELGIANGILRFSLKLMYHPANINTLSEQLPKLNNLKEVELIFPSTHSNEVSAQLEKIKDEVDFQNKCNLILPITLDNSRTINGSQNIIPYGVVWHRVNLTEAILSDFWKDLVNTKVITDVRFIQYTALIPLFNVITRLEIKLNRVLIESSTIFPDPLSRTVAELMVDVKKKMNYVTEIDICGYWGMTEDIIYNKNGIIEDQCDIVSKIHRFECTTRTGKDGSEFAQPPSVDSEGLKLWRLVHWNIILDVKTVEGIAKHSATCLYFNVYPSKKGESLFVALLNPETNLFKTLKKVVLICHFITEDDYKAIDYFIENKKGDDISITVKRQDN